MVPKLFRMKKATGFPTALTNRTSFHRVPTLAALALLLAIEGTDLRTIRTNSQLSGGPPHSTAAALVPPQYERRDSKYSRTTSILGSAPQLA